jgi:hypothetical protein
LCDKRDETRGGRNWTDLTGAEISDVRFYLRIVQEDGKFADCSDVYFSRYLMQIFNSHLPDSADSGTQFFKLIYGHRTC